MVYLVSAVVSDIDSDYKSDINDPVGHNSHHNNISVHQFGSAVYSTKPHSSSSPHTHNNSQDTMYNGANPPLPEHDFHQHNNHAGDRDYREDSFDYSQADDYFLSDGDYDPSIDYRDEFNSVGDKSYDGEDSTYDHMNNGSRYPDDVDYRDRENNQRNLFPTAHNNNNGDYIGGDDHSYNQSNVSHNHWDMNGYQYHEYDDSASEFSTNTSRGGYPTSTDNRPVPRARGGTAPPSPAPSPAARSPGRSPVPMPAPRKMAVCESSDNTSSPYFERRSDTSEPLFYNSRPANEDG